MFQKFTITKKTDSKTNNKNIHKIRAQKPLPPLPIANNEYVNGVQGSESARVTFQNSTKHETKPEKDENEDYVDMNQTRVYTNNNLTTSSHTTFPRMKKEIKHNFKENRRQSFSIFSSKFKLTPTKAAKREEEISKVHIETNSQVHPLVNEGYLEPNQPPPIPSNYSSSNRLWFKSAPLPMPPELLPRIQKEPASLEYISSNEEDGIYESVPVYKEKQFEENSSNINENSQKTKNLMKYSQPVFCLPPLPTQINNSLTLPQTKYDGLTNPTATTKIDVSPLKFKSKPKLVPKPPTIKKPVEDSCNTRPTGSHIDFPVEVLPPPPELLDSADSLSLLTKGNIINTRLPPRIQQVSASPEYISSNEEGDIYEAEPVYKEKQLQENSSNINQNSMKYSQAVFCLPPFPNQINNSLTLPQTKYDGLTKPTETTNIDVFPSKSKCKPKPCPKPTTIKKPVEDSPETRPTGSNRDLHVEVLPPPPGFLDSPDSLSSLTKGFIINTKLPPRMQQVPASPENISSNEEDGIYEAAPVYKEKQLQENSSNINQNSQKSKTVMKYSQHDACLPPLPNQINNSLALPQTKYDGLTKPTATTNIDVFPSKSKWKPNPVPKPPTIKKPVENSRETGTLAVGNIWNLSEESALPRPPPFKNLFGKYQLKFMADSIPNDEATDSSADEEVCKFNPNNFDFFRNTDRKGAKQLLQKMKNLENGAFLLRPSREKSYVLGLTIFHDGYFYNLGVSRDSEGNFYCKSCDNMKSIKFSSLTMFVDYYKNNALKIKNKNVSLYLKYSLPKNIF